MDIIDGDIQTFKNIATNRDKDKTLDFFDYY